MGVKGRRDHAVEIGRVCVVNHGAENGKICTIVDIVDQNRALVDGPVDVTGVARKLINFRSLTLTSFVAPIPRGAGSAIVASVVKGNGIVEKFQNTNWSRKSARFTAKRNMTDLDRFKKMIIHKQRQRLIGREMATIKRDNKAPKLKPRKVLKAVDYKKRQFPRPKRALPTAIVEDKKKGDKDAAPEEKKKKK